MNKTTINSISQYETIPKVVDFIIEKLNPEKIILFGSCARGCITRYSDIDMCLVMKRKTDSRERINIRALLLEELLKVTEYEIDLYICNEEEWDANHHDESTFIGKIYKEGKIIYGR